MSGEGGGGHGESTGAIAAAFLANLGIAVGGDQLAGGRVRDLRRARRGCRRPNWRDGLCHACWRLAVLFKKDPRMFAYKPLDDYGDERDAVEFPWEEWEREARGRGLDLTDVIARAGDDEEPRPEA